MCTFEGPGASNTTKIPREDPKRGKKENCGGRVKKKARNFGALSHRSSKPDLWPQLVCHRFFLRLNSPFAHSVDQPRILCQSVCETRCHAACVAPCGAPLGWLHQRICGDSDCACRGQHACPASFRSPRDLVRHVLWDIACADSGEPSDRVHCFLALSSARLHGEDDQSAPVGCGQFVSAPTQHRPLPRAVVVRLKERADQGDVHSDLCTPETRKILGEDLMSRR